MKTGSKGWLMKDLSEVIKRYRLRKAAGTYWIIDVEQPGVPYREPLAVNDVGAGIWELLLDGKEKSQVADILCHEYDIGKQQVLSDIDRFLQQLRAQGIEI